MAHAAGCAHPGLHNCDAAWAHAERLRLWQGGQAAVQDVCQRARRALQGLEAAPLPLVRLGSRFGQVAPAGHTLAVSWLLRPGLPGVIQSWQADGGLPSPA